MYFVLMFQNYADIHTRVHAHTNLNMMIYFSQPEYILVSPGSKSYSIV
jgi:hypothetical protein